MHCLSIGQTIYSPLRENWSSLRDAAQPPPIRRRWRSGNRLSVAITSLSKRAVSMGGSTAAAVCGRSLGTRGVAQRPHDRISIGRPGTTGNNGRRVAVDKRPSRRLPNSGRATTSLRAASPQEFTIDDLLNLIPSPGKRLEADDLMFSTNSQGKSDPSVLREYIRQHSDGPPRFMSPAVWLSGDQLPQGADREDLPLMLYLPGLDGSGICAARQFPLLQKSFDLRKLVIPLTDRTPFPQLVSIVKEYLAEEVGRLSPRSNRPVYILGESFGGILALAVAAASRDIVDRVVLVNPATSFQRSIWPSFGPILSQLPGDLYRVAPFALVPLLGDPIRMASFYTPRTAPPTEQLEYLAQSLISMMPLLGMLTDLLPSDTLEWKIKILSEGCEYTLPKYNQVDMPVLVIAGNADLLIPSKEEAQRLNWQLDDCRKVVLEGHSHILMQEQGVDIAEIIRDTKGFYISQNPLPPGPTNTDESRQQASPAELEAQNQQLQPKQQPDSSTSQKIADEEMGDILYKIMNG